jgi:hypothetical protein
VLALAAVLISGLAHRELEAFFRVSNGSSGTSERADAQLVRACVVVTDAPARFRRCRNGSLCSVSSESSPTGFVDSPSGSNPRPYPDCLINFSKAERLCIRIVL